MKKIWVLSLLVLIFNTPVGALQSASASSDELMKEVRAMRGEIKDLKQTIDQMQVLINALAASQLKSGSLQAGNEGLNCNSRVVELERKLDQFTVLGYTADHPDVKSVAAKINVLKEECAAEKTEG